MNLISENSVTQKKSDYSVHYENNLTKIKIKKVYNTEDDLKDEVDGCLPQIMENSEFQSNLKIEERSETNKNEEDSKLDNKRRRSGNLNSSNEENSPKICQEKKRSKIEQRQKMFDEYYPWVLQTYGDAAKTKTITIKKLNRIINALNGKESNRPDSSKFRFWVKTKGFTTIKPDNFLDATFDEALDNLSKLEVTPLYVLLVSDSGTQTYKQVAVVEKFFDIIYHVHVGLGSKRCGRHAGQKRTYRTITETYAFLPREAVSKFLTLCIQCKKQQITDKKDPSLENVSNYYDNRYFTNNLPDTTPIKYDKNRLDYKIKSDWKEESKFTEIELPKNLSNDTDVTSSQTGRNLFKPYENNNNNKYSDNGSAGPQKLVTPVNLNINETLTYYQLLNYFYRNLNQTNIRSSAKVQSDEKFTSNLLDKPLFVSKISNQPNDFQIKIEKNVTEQSEEIVDSYFNGLKIPTPTKSFRNGSHHSMTNSKLVTSTPETNSRQEIQGNGSEVVKQMTSTYLSMTRSFGLEDDDALNLESVTGNANPTEPPEQSETNSNDPYGNMLKDTEKLKLMLLAWNYQNSAAVQNGTDGPDFATMSALWSQYQNALALTGDKAKLNPIQTEHFNVEEMPKSDTPDENNSSGQKEDDDSEDESDDKLEQSPQDPERLKAFNMFVRLFIDENLDRMVPISKQPKEKVQAIIDSCTRQFPEFSERARKRVRTYLKSCRRNKKTRDGWENTTRPTPAHLTSVQAEQILALACENESLNVKRMRVGLEPIGHGSDLNSMTLVTNTSQIEPDTVTIPTPANIARISPISNGNNNVNNQNVAQNLSTHSKLQQPSCSNAAQLPRIITVENNSPVNYTVKPEILRESVKEQTPSTPKNYHAIFANPTNTPTDLSLKRPVFPHKLSPSEILAVKQLITGYRESAAFLLRSADELEQLLQQQ